MITTDELKVQLADYGTAVKDLEEALAIDASRKRVQELEHTMSRPGFYDDTELSKKLKLADGGDAYLFGTTMQGGDHVLIRTAKISR